MSCHLIFKFKSIDRWQHRAKSLNSKKTATLTCFHSFEDVDANFIQMSRFCVGDRFYLCDNRILCQYDYEERIIFANLAPPNGAPPQPVSIRSFSFKSPSGGTLPFPPFFSMKIRWNSGLSFPNLFIWVNVGWGGRQTWPIHWLEPAGFDQNENVFAPRGFACSAVAR